MFRFIRTVGFKEECVEGDRVVFRRNFLGTVTDSTGKRGIRQTGGSITSVRYDTFDETLPYQRPPEPHLRWKTGYPLIRKTSVESDGLSGPVIFERVAEQIMYRVGEIEWRYDVSQRELYFDIPNPTVELRVTLLAFQFYLGSMPD